MRRFALFMLFAITLAAGWASVGPGDIFAAYAYPPNPCDEW
jgi:hypothetical protein